MKQDSSSLEKTISALALLIVGICFVVWSDKVTEWIAIALGIMALIAAATRTAKYFHAKPEARTSFSLFGIVLLAAVGIMLISRADFIKEAISFIIGIYIIFSCITQLVALSSLRRQDNPTKSYFWPIIGVIIGILCITGKFIVPDALATITGVALIIYAVVYLIGLVTITKATKTTSHKTSHKEIAEATIIKEAEIVKKPSKKKSEQKSKK